MEHSMQSVPGALDFAHEMTCSNFKLWIIMFTLNYSTTPFWGSFKFVWISYSNMRFCLYYIVVSDEQYDDSLRRADL